ncbi:hypothetical protein D3C86_1747150 [compost metagenome]
MELDFHLAAILVAGLDLIAAVIDIDIADFQTKRRDPVAQIRFAHPVGDRHIAATATIIVIRMGDRGKANRRESNGGKDNAFHDGFLSN